MLLRYSGYNSSSTRSSNETDRDCSTRGLVAQDLYLYCSHAFLKGTESHNRIPVALALPSTYSYRRFRIDPHEYRSGYQTATRPDPGSIFRYRANRCRRMTSQRHRDERRSQMNFAKG